MYREQLHPNQYVQSIVNEWPQSKAVFFALETACIGCPLARFCTLADVADTYQLSPDLLLEKIQSAIQVNLTIQSGGPHDNQ
jgi:hypothetical protein